MNKKYIKRQLTLNEIGIPMDEDIRGYYKVFKKYINKEKLFIDNEYHSELILYRDDKYFNIDTNIWSELSIEYAFERKDINKIVSAFLEKQLNVEINFTNTSDIILAYETNRRRFHLSVNIYTDFKYDCNLEYQQTTTDELLCIFLEHHFNLETIDVKVF